MFMKIKVRKFQMFLMSMRYFCLKYNFVCQLIIVKRLGLGLGTGDLGPGNRIENREYPQSQEMKVKSNGH